LQFKEWKHIVLKPPAFAVFLLSENIFRKNLVTKPFKQSSSNLRCLLFLFPGRRESRPVQSVSLL